MLQALPIRTNKTHARPRGHLLCGISTDNTGEACLVHRLGAGHRTVSSSSAIHPVSAFERFQGAHQSSGSDESRNMPGKDPVSPIYTGSSPNSNSLAFLEENDPDHMKKEKVVEEEASERPIEVAPGEPARLLSGKGRARACPAIANHCCVSQCF